MERLWNERNGAHELLDGGQLARRCEALDGELGADRADDAIEGAAIDGEPTVRALDDLLQDLVRRRGHLDGVDLAARCHHLPHAEPR
jgi:hypothetical protein